MNKNLSIFIGTFLVAFIGIIWLCTANISFAAVSDCYLTMEGTVEVSAPEFYIGSIAEEELLINEKPSDCGQFNIIGEYRTFKTADLGGVDFKYIPEVEFSFRAKGVTSASQGLIVSFGYYAMANPGVPLYLCSQTINLTQNMENYTLSFINCSHAPQQVDGLFYEFKKQYLGYEYVIDKCENSFYTKIKLRD